VCLPCCVCGPSAAAPAVHHSRDHGGLCGCRADCEAARGGRGERQAAERPTPLSQAPDQHAAHAASKHTAGTARMACALSCMCVPSAACRLLHGPSVAACANSAEGLAGRIFLIAPAGIGYVADSMSPPCCHPPPPPVAFRACRRRTAWCSATGVPAQTATRRLCRWVGAGPSQPVIRPAGQLHTAVARPLWCSWCPCPRTIDRLLGQLQWGLVDVLHGRCPVSCTAPSQPAWTTSRGGCK
jgi:hypothetical protein